MSDEYDYSGSGIPMHVLVGRLAGRIEAQDAMIKDLLETIQAIKAQTNQQPVLDAVAALIGEVQAVKAATRTAKATADAAADFLAVEDDTHPQLAEKVNNTNLQEMVSEFHAHNDFIDRASSTFGNIERRLKTAEQVLAKLTS